MCCTHALIHTHTHTHSLTHSLTHTQNKAYTAKNGQLGTDEVQVKDEDRKVFFTDAGRTVRDSGGIEPDIKLDGIKVGELERELERKNLFFEFASVYEAKHLADGEELSKQPAPLATDEVYADFKQFVMQQTDMAIESPFDKSLEIMKTALEETGFTAAQGEVDALKSKLKALTVDEFAKDEQSIRKRLDLMLRQRFVPDSIVTSVSLVGDDQVKKALELALDAGKYEATLNLARKGPQTTASVESAERKMDSQELVNGAGPWTIFGGHP